MSGESPRFQPHFRAFQQGRPRRPRVDPQAVSTETLLGTMVHATLCTAARLRLATPPVTVDRDLIDSLWELEWRTEPPAVRHGHYDLFLAGRTMLRHYVASPNFRDHAIYQLPVSSPAGRELRPMLEFPFVLEVADGRQVAGRFDRVDNREGRPVVVDYKTGAMTPESLHRYQLQMRLYALAICDLTGATEVDCELHWVRTNTVTRYHFSRAELEAQRGSAISWALRHPDLGDEGHHMTPGTAADGLGL